MTSISRAGEASRALPATVLDSRSPGRGGLLRAFSVGDAIVRLRRGRRVARGRPVPTLVLRLAIHRISFLRPSEKRRLEAAVAGGVELSSLSFSTMERIVGRLVRSRDWHPERLLDLAEADLRFLDRSGSRYLSPDDPEYPPLLREIHEPPYGLFVRGAPLVATRPSLAIVGTRSATGRGMSLASAFGRDAALAGLPVVSGLARGIDAAAHRGAIAAKRLDEGAAPTVAVLPVGVDSVYPHSHRPLASAILERGGSLVSEYPSGESPMTWRFPERNRVIAGMARATLVVEAPDASGALITAHHALDEGRDVCVVLGNLGGPMNAGADRLASEGAIPLSSLDELLSEWGCSIPRVKCGTERDRRSGGDGESRGCEAALLADALRAELGLEGS